MNLVYETEQIEFKKTTAELKEGIISLASMLNKHGSAKLYFGVANNGDVLGQQIGANTLRDISQAIANSIKPQVIPNISQNSTKIKQSFSSLSPAVKSRIRHTGNITFVLPMKIAKFLLHSCVSL